MSEPLADVYAYVEAAAKSSGVTTEITVWSYPETQREARESMSEGRQQQLTELAYLFQAPKPILVTKDKEKADDSNGPDELMISFLPSQYVHQAARIQQVTGHFENAIPDYMRLQLWRDFPPPAKNKVEESRNSDKKIVLPAAPNAVFVTPQVQAIVQPNLPPEILDLHRRAAAEASIWQAMCRLSLGKYGIAASDFERHLQLPPGAPFQEQARFLGGIATALDNRMSRGAAFLRRMPESDERYRAARFFMRRWQPK